MTRSGDMAFPLLTPSFTARGMTLREHYAGLVMAAFVTTDVSFGTEKSPYNPWPWCAAQAVAAADALLAELGKPR